MEQRLAAKGDQEAKKIGSLEDDMADLKDQLSSSKAELAKMKVELDQSKSELNERGEESGQLKEKIKEFKEEQQNLREKKERLQEIVLQLSEIAKNELATLREDLKKTKEMLKFEVDKDEVQEAIESKLQTWDKSFENVKRDVMDKNHKYIKNLQTNLQKYELKIQTLESKLLHSKAHQQDSNKEVHVSYNGNLEIFQSAYQANKLREMATAIKQ